MDIEDSYKIAKEAFHANNLGSSIWSINAVSLAALASYIFYATLAARLRPSPLMDYISMALPLLLSVTIFATRPIFFNTVLLAISGTIHFTSRLPQRPQHASRNNQLEREGRKSKGKWLDESDSDEEPAKPPNKIPESIAIPSPQLPSEVVITSSSRSGSATSTHSATLSPELPILEDGNSKSNSTRSRKKRHSPTPSTHSHTAINVLTTPELLGSHALSASARQGYPSYSAATATGASIGEKQKLPFLSVYRAHMMLMTVHCILAVDFPVFPRWQGKCEDFGTSLMDVGVGSFVFSLGIVSTRSFARSATATQSLSERIGKSLWKAAPILALGMVRVLMVKGTEYPEHVTEYGVHWNFFFTLGLLPVFGNLLWPLRQRVFRWTVMGIVTGILHETALLQAGLQSWILSESRIGLLGMNKEGIVSLPGYLAIYLLGLATGEHILRSAAPPKSRISQDTSSRRMNEDFRSHYEKRRTELALELFSYSVAWWGSLWIMRLMDFEVSRRMANLAYILWTSAYNTTFLFFYLLIEIIFFSSRGSRFQLQLVNPVPPLLAAINDNGLAVFLVANLMTGLINVSMQTMWTGDGMAMVVLIGYSMSICGLAWIGRRWKLKLG